MTAQAVRDALEGNRAYTDYKDAQARLAQAERDLKCGFIEEQEYLRIVDVCQKMISSYRR